MDDLYTENLPNFHKDFIHEFMADHSKKTHILSMPTGTGKTSIVTAVIGATVNKDSSSRILIITLNRELSDQYKLSLDKLGLSTRVLVLDIKIFRVLVANSTNSDVIFPEGIVCITTWNNILFQKDIYKRLLHTCWSLSVFDEVRSSNYEDIRNIQNLIDNPNFSKLLIMTNPHELTDLIDSLSNPQMVEVTKYSGQDLIKTSYELRVNFKTIPFTRTQEELNFQKAYLSVARYISKTSMKGLINKSSYDSSFYLAEQELRNLRNRIVHGDMLNWLDQNLEMNENSLIENDENRIQHESSNISKALHKAEEAILLINNIQIDSKYESLEALLKGLWANEARILIFARSKLVRIHLTENLLENFSNVYFLSIDEYEGADKTINSFRDRGGILVSSIHELKGFNFPTDAIILYDIPQTQLELFMLISRSSPTQSLHTQQINVIALHDISSCDPSDKSKIKRLEKWLEPLM